MEHLARALSLSLVGLVGAFVAANGGCSSDEPRRVAEGCLVNTDCADPLVCAFRKCHVQCHSSRDCDPGQLCVASDRPFYVCQLEEERSCAYNSDCPLGQSCAVDLQCRDQCFATRDCLPDQVCVAGSCADVTELKEGSLISKRGEADASSGQPCLYTSQCPSPLACRNNLCSNECLAASDCVSGYDCVNNRCVAGSGTLIGLAGGVVAASGGNVKLTIPPNALRAPVSILMLPVDAWPDGALGHVYQIEPNGLQFLIPATLTFTYAATELGELLPSSLRMAQAIGSSWQPLVSTVNVGERTVTSKLEHLSVYGIIGPSSDAGATATGTGLDGSTRPNGDASGIDASGVDAADRAATGQGDAAALGRLDAGAASL